ncbi:MAG TPA: Stk1 family PASTA domain-containing Ser/Thr kinase [Actinomycetota bacterium]|nr:Stk1 family PASTA domain-containing Ser/Thr kinase [Actinomycetota bacterium]
MKLMRDLVGDTLSSRYRLIARVAGGGMGEVYRGHDLLLDRTVAVKVLQPNLAEDPELVARFKAEARAAARLTHPNVVAVYDWGAEDTSTYYMVMEYVPGTDVRDVLVTRGSVEVAQALEIVASVCDALAAAHNGGLVHRDVKPENVLIARSGTVKVADFGIAAAAGVDRLNPGPAISGTLRYLAPEQAAGREATIASDVWAAGALLSELVTGMPPLQGAGNDLLRRRATEPPVAPSAFGAKVPRRVDAIVAKACAVDPAQRYSSASEMGAAVRRAAAELRPPAPLEELLDEVTGEIRLPDMEPTDFAPRGARKMRRGRRIRTMALLVFFALVALGGARGIAALVAPERFDVPVLVGMTEDDAEDAAEEAGVGLAIERRVHDFGSEVGEVLSQDPAGGVMTEGETISVVLSSGPPPMRVPNLTGVPLAIARIQLRMHELELGRVVQRFDLAPKGTVIGQDPARGRLDWGSRVKVIVSKGPASIVVPDVAGMTVAKATKALEQAGFEVKVTDVYSDDVPSGRVVATVPAGTSEAPEGSTIEIQRSIGPEFEQVVMPDVRNMSLKAARNKLENLGLRVSVREVGGACPGGGTVADTDPLPGTKIRENDRVAVFVVC